jgi:hypothetical protein
VAERFAEGDDSETELACGWNAALCAVEEAVGYQLSRSQWSRRLLAAAERYFDTPGDVEAREELFRSRRPLDRYDAQVMRPAVRALALATGRHGFALSPARLCAEAASYAARAARRPAVEQVAQAAMLRDIFGPLPYREVVINPLLLAWKDGVVVKLARAIYEERAFDRMPVLADALEEAGADDQEIVPHCRSQSDHVLGCWALDSQGFVKPRFGWPPQGSRVRASEDTGFRPLPGKEEGSP